VKTNKKSRKTVLELGSKKAKKFFLQNDSYFSLEIPSYFRFDKLLNEIEKIVSQNSNIRLSIFKSAKKSENVNYIILTNKDGKYAWRSIQLINPFIYVYLVNVITEQNNWKEIKTKFKEFQKCKNIECKSLPVISTSKNKNKGEQILQWLEEIEKESLKLALDYNFLIETDISNCYGTIYTHSIPWALHGRSKAKSDRSEKLIGNKIDQLIQSMQYGQTNGIPQGSVLMDFIAEIVLGAIDLEISDKTNNLNLEFKILRYRDDYRIFVKDLKTGEKILKIISEVLSDYGLALNNEKTIVSSQIIKASFKEDKFDWITNKKKPKNLLKYLLMIYQHSLTYPNSGTIITTLYDYYKKVKKLKKIKEDVEILISILVNIAYQNPRTHHIVSAIISYLIRSLGNQYRKKILTKIREKFNDVPNVGHLELWLQRISIPYDKNIKYDEKMCQLVLDKLNNNKTVNLWNSGWINVKSIKNLLDDMDIINLNNLKKVMNYKTIKDYEIQIFYYPV